MAAVDPERMILPDEAGDDIPVLWRLPAEWFHCATHRGECFPLISWPPKISHRSRGDDGWLRRRRG